MSRTDLKRPFDFHNDSEVTGSCSPRRYYPVDVKKSRRTDYIKDEGDRSVCLASGSTRDSVFVPHQPVEEFVHAFTEASIPSSRTPTPTSSYSSLIYPEKKKEKKYTAAEVSRLVQEALSIRENQLREQYENTLKSQLQQQFESFQSYHNEYISRNFRNKDSSYIS